MLTEVCALLQVTDGCTGKRPATDSANISAGASSVQPTTNSVTFCSQPDVRVFGNTQNASQVNNCSSKQTTAPGRGRFVTVETSATCSTGGRTAGTGAWNSVNSVTMETSGPKAGTRNMSISRNVGSWKGFPVPDEAPSPLRMSANNSATHSVHSENVSPFGAHSVNSKVTHLAIHSVDPNLLQSGFCSMRTMEGTPVVNKGNGVETPSASGKGATPKLKLPLMEGSRSKPAASEQNTLTDFAEKTGAGNMVNVSGHSGSGWEHLNLYHSNREAMVNQGEAKYKSERVDASHCHCLSLLHCVQIKVTIVLGCLFFIYAKFLKLKMFSVNFMTREIVASATSGGAVRILSLSLSNIYAIQYINLLPSDKSTRNVS